MDETRKDPNNRTTLRRIADLIRQRQPLGLAVQPSLWERCASSVKSALAARFSGLSQGTRVGGMVRLSGKSLDDLNDFISLVAL